ncbi:MAG: cytochrome c [Phycisphaerae bacterium]|nr:cytochrome c [Saprospiraceae bacterium]
MKLKIIASTAIFTLLVIGLSWQGCKKDDNDGPPCTLTNPDLSYTKNIKAIIDQQCISCHVTGSGVPGIVGDYTTYEGIKSRLDNGKVLDRVVVKKDMPQGGGMSQAQRDSINCWIAAGYPK